MNRTEQKAYLKNMGRELIEGGQHPDQACQEEWNAYIQAREHFDFSEFYQNFQIVRAAAFKRFQELNK